MSVVVAGQDDRIPELRARVDLVELASRLGGVETKRSGGTVTFHCPNPAHEDRNPSFTVKAGRWKCWSVCGVGGDAIDLVVWLKGVTKAEAIEELAAIAGLERYRVADDNPVTLTAAGNHARLVAWCAQRGWGPHVIDELGLTVVVDKFSRARVRFPFRLDGKVHYHQDRRLDDSPRYKYLSPERGRPIPYEADRLRLAEDRGHVFIVEGVTDVAALVDVYTAPAVVGVPGVDAWRPNWAQAFRGLAVYVVADNDKAGETFRSRVAGDLVLVARSVLQVFVPDQHNDVAAWRKGLDPEKFDQQLTAAVEIASTGPTT